MSLRGASSDAMLSRYLDGELSAAERAAVDAQLAANAGLREHLRRLTEAQRLFRRELAPKPMPEPVRQRLLAIGDEANTEEAFDVPLELLGGSSAGSLDVRAHSKGRARRKKKE